MGKVISISPFRQAQDRLSTEVRPIPLRPQAPSKSAETLRQPLDKGSGQERLSAKVRASTKAQPTPLRPEAPSKYVLIELEAFEARRANDARRKAEVRRKAEAQLINLETAHGLRWLRDEFCKNDQRMDEAAAVNPETAVRYAIAALQDEFQKAEKYIRTWGLDEKHKKASMNFAISANMAINALDLAITRLKGEKP